MAGLVEQLRTALSSVCCETHKWKRKSGKWKKQAQSRRLQGALWHSCLKAGVCSEAFLKCLYTNVHQTGRVMVQSLGYKKIAGVKTFWDSTYPHITGRKKRWQKQICSYEPSLRFTDKMSGWSAFWYFVLTFLSIDFYSVPTCMASEKKLFYFIR